MPYFSCAPPSATRKPVITSSKISTVPDGFVSIAQELQKTAARRHAAHVADDGLDDDAGDFVSALT